jgi:hypothetical protein
VFILLDCYSLVKDIQLSLAARIDTYKHRFEPGCLQGPEKFGLDCIRACEDAEWDIDAALFQSMCERHCIFPSPLPGPDELVVVELQYDTRIAIRQICHFFKDVLDTSLSPGGPALSTVEG